jgi:hypothetical protein
VVDGERQHRGREQQQGDDCTFLEILLADNELEHVGGEHVEVAADHLGNAEVGDDEREGHERGGDQPVLGARQRDGEELACRAGAHRIGGFIQARVGGGERSDQDHQRMREGREDLGQHDAGGTVDLLDAQPRQPGLEHALVAEPVDQRDGREQRGCQQGHQRDRARQALEAHSAARQRIGEAKGGGNGDERHHHRDPDAVPQGVEQCGRARIVDEVGQAHVAALCVFDRLLQDGAQRCSEESEQRQRNEQQRRMGKPFRPVDVLAHSRGAQRHRGHPATSVLRTAMNSPFGRPGALTGLPSALRAAG